MLWSCSDALKQSIVCIKTRLQWWKWEEKREVGEGGVTSLAEWGWYRKFHKNCWVSKHADGWSCCSASFCFTIQSQPVCATLPNASKLPFGINYTTSWYQSIFNNMEKLWSGHFFALKTICCRLNAYFAYSAFSFSLEVCCVNQFY